MKWMEWSKRSLNVLMKHDHDDGVNKAQPKCACICQRKVKRQRHEMTTKKRDYENEGSSMHEVSCIGINYAHTHIFPKCCRSLHTLFSFALCIVSSIFILVAAQFWPAREFLGVVFTHSVGCSRPTSAVSDPLATKWEQQKQIPESRSSEVSSKNRTQRVSPFYHLALHASSFVDFLWIVMNSTKNHSIATNWKKNSMIGAVADTSRMASAWVVVLQILGVNGIM